jgi:hypothetical protein
MQQILFELEVVETRTYTLHYIVAAKDEDEALYKASIGDTHAEGDGRIGDVLDRTIVSEARAIGTYDPHQFINQSASMGACEPFREYPDG